ncbi:MAG: hypothetical protein JSU77_08830 [Fidelibacterota bacterium]|nr:MAG: hypothetical protein JSU77_08830 [Candidatus Neomarinimicrobiota bacterium]
MKNRFDFLDKQSNSSEISWLFKLVLFLALWGLVAPTVAAGQIDRIQLKTVPIRHWNFSNVDKDAQMWSGMYIASNNRIYIGLCTHGDAANVYEFDIEKEQMRHLANLTVLLGERGKGIWTNGKIHVQMQELDGYIYFGSLCEDNGPPRIDASSYRGPWWFRISMETGEVTPLSRINSFWGLLGQCMDKQRRLIYGLAEDGHLYKYYIDEDWTEDLGRVDDWDICRTIFLDDLGRVHGSYPPGRLWRYNPEQDRIFDLKLLRLPVALGSRNATNPMLDRRSQWRIIEWDPVTRCAYGIVGGSNMLFRYDVHDSHTGNIDVLTQVSAPMYRGGDPSEVPHATLAMTISQTERKIYYIPVISGDFDYAAVNPDFGRVSPKKARGSALSGDQMPPLSFMISYDLETGERRDIGLLRADDGRWAYGMGGAETDRQGRIWFVGAFEESDPGYVARKIRNKFPYSMGLGCYDPAK